MFPQVAEVLFLALLLQECAEVSAIFRLVHQMYWTVGCVILLATGFCSSDKSNLHYVLPRLFFSSRSPRWPRRSVSNYIHMVQGLRFYKFIKIHKEGVHLRSSMSNIAAPAYQLSMHLAGMLGPLIGYLLYHMESCVAPLQGIC
jgi:hypothetical protein